MVVSQTSVDFENLWAFEILLDSQTFGTISKSFSGSLTALHETTTTGKKPRYDWCWPLFSTVMRKGNVCNYGYSCRCS